MNAAQRVEAAQAAMSTALSALQAAKSAGADVQTISVLRDAYNRKRYHYLNVRDRAEGRTANAAALQLVEAISHLAEVDTAQ